MIQVCLAATLLIGIYKLILPKNNVLDWWASIMFAAIPGIVAWLLSIVIRTIGLNPLWISSYYLVCFLLPFIYFMMVEEYPAHRSAFFALVVPVVMFVTDLAAGLILQQLAGAE